MALAAGVALVGNDGKVRLGVSRSLNSAELIGGVLFRKMKV